MAAGFRGFELGATITGEPLYAVRDYPRPRSDRGDAGQRCDVACDPSVAGDPNGEGRRKLNGADFNP
jgi:hypothetical protein